MKQKITTISELKQRGRKRKQHAQQLKTFKALSLNDKLKVIREYNDKHSTHITYGKFIAAVENGTINLKELNL